MAVTRAAAARVLCVGFPGARPDEIPLERLRALRPGGAILFARNVTTPAATAELVAAVRGAAGDGCVVAVDQEGGRVARLRDGVVAFPPAMALGATRDPALAERAGAQLGRDLRRIGADVDFAPVADLALESRNTVIGGRALGADPQAAGTLAAALARGLARAGIVAVPKHFPGHGATAVDSHRGLPRLDVPRETLAARELVPFRACVDAGARGLMVGHLVVPALDPERPASLSPAAIGGLLRGELGFAGTVVTDCLEMGAIAESVGTVRAALLALQAGADWLIVSHRLELAEAIVDELVRAVEDGRLAPERLAEAGRRVAALRARAAADPGPDDPEIGPEIARRAVTVVRGDPRIAPGAPATVISFEADEADGVGDATRASLATALRRRGVKAEIMRIALDPQPDDLALLRSVVAGLGERAYVIVTRRADLHPAQRAAIDALLALRPRAHVVSAREPYDAALFPAAVSLACVYGDQQVCFDALGDVFAGRATAGGRLPVPVGVP